MPGFRRPSPSPTLGLLCIALIAAVIYGMLGVGPVHVGGAGAAATSQVEAMLGETTASPAQTLAPSPAQSPGLVAEAPTATPTPEPALDLVPLVPIVSFWSTERSISRADLIRLLGGDETSAAEQRPVAVSVEDVPALATAFGIQRSGFSSPQVRMLEPAEVRSFVQKTPGALGIVRADDVALGVRAIAIDGVALFGIGRTTVLSEWPLLVSEPGVASQFTTAGTWTVAAGGDVMLDKAVYAQSILANLGVDYAWFGGTAAIDGRYCCGWGGDQLAVGHRTGGAGAFEALMHSADLALANLESPEPNDFRYHADGFTFTGDPALLAGLKDAGIDAVSLANNHIGNDGPRGVTDTIAHLDELRIGHAGAAANRSDARKPAWLQASGLKIAFLAYSWVQPTDYWATDYAPGAAFYSIGAVAADIKAAKAAGADYVIVMPHWGMEYTDSLLPDQQDGARAMIAAGADLILGSHSHWFGPIQQLGPDNLVFYSLGDLVFDWTHDERTQESAVADLTFVGRRLIQVDLHPTFIIAGQPNLLDPAGDGQTVLGQIRATSQSLLGW